MIQVENPYTNQIMALAPKGDEVDAQNALAAAQAGQPAWAATPSVTRAEALKKMARVIRENRIELAHTLVQEQAKILPLAQVEIDFTADYFDYYAGWARIYQGEIIQSDRANENFLLYRQPITGMVTLTGSVEAGSRIIAASAENITKTSLELGGKAPAIGCADADLDLAVKAVKDSRVIFSGQVCNCPEWVYVHASVRDAFVEKLVAAIKAMVLDDPFADPAPEMSSQVSQDQFEKISAMVERAGADGAEVLCGGKRAQKDSGYFYEPTVLADCRQEMDVVQKEIFGPVLPVLSFSDMHKPVRLAVRTKIKAQFFKDLFSSKALTHAQPKYGKTNLSVTLGGDSHPTTTQRMIATNPEVSPDPALLFAMVNR